MFKKFSFKSILAPYITLYYYHAQKESFRSIRKKDSLSGYVIQEGGGC